MTWANFISIVKGLLVLMGLVLSGLGYLFTVFLFLVPLVFFVPLVAKTSSELET